MADIYDINRPPDATGAPQDAPSSLAEFVTGPRAKRVAASFQVKVDDVLRTACTRCGHEDSGQGVDLNVTVGPVIEGARVLLIPPGADMYSVLDDVRRAMVHSALRDARGNQAKAAKSLGVKYSTFHALVRRLEASRDDGAEDTGAEATGES